MHDDAALPLLYTDLAGWFHLLTAPHEYEEEAAVYRAALLAHAPRTRTLLELGSGGGNNAWWLKRDFACTLSDLSQPMLDLSLRVNPDCEHVQGDMRTLRLGRTFDAVLVHDAVMYMLTEEDLRRAIDTAYVHCNTGGVALFVPDFVRETFAPGTECGGNDGDDGRGLRYLEWCWDPDPRDATYVTDYACLLRSPDGDVRAVHDRHIEGLFPRATWLRLLEGAGFRATEARDGLPDDFGVMFVATK